jgi:HD-like signal output (HDOD) protein
MRSPNSTSAVARSAAAQARVVVADDDELILRSLRRLLRDKTSEWDLLFTTDADTAARGLDEVGVRVLVSDFRMKVGNGTKLLEVARERHPEVARIVLSGDATADAALHLVPAAHQFLAKPFEPDRLRAMLERVCALPALLKNESLRAVIGRDNDLPSSPSVHDALSRALAKSKTSLAEIAAIAERDVGIAAQLLRLASSPVFGPPRAAATMQDAVAALGLDTLRNLVRQSHVIAPFRVTPALAHFSPESLSVHAVATARLARELLDARSDADDAFTTGLLHNVGQFVLASRVPHRFAEALDGTSRMRALLETERELMGFTHAAVGAYLLGLWGIRPAVVDAVLHHGAPHRTDDDANVATAVHVAAVLAKNPEAPVVEDATETTEATQTTEAMTALPAAYLERLRVRERLPRLRELATRLRATAES